MKGKRLLAMAHSAMLGAIVVSAVAAFAAYGANDHLRLQWQLAAHLVLLVIPVFLKLGYIMRLSALKQLGKPLH